MGSLKEVRGRISSVISTQQITKAMKMVSAAKLRRAQNAIVQIRPYTAKLKGTIGNLVSSLEGEVTLDLAHVRAVNKVAIVVVTSDKGLCGAFNNNVIKAARNLITTKYASQHAQGNLEVFAIGRKGADFFRKAGYQVNTEFQSIASVAGGTSFESVAALGNKLIAAFKAQEIDAIEVVYSEFKNAATQFFRVNQWLPLVPQVLLGQVSNQNVASADYIYEPDKETIINNLVPTFLKVELFKAILDTTASEHGARMTSMDKATENAGELLKNLRLLYNRERQAAITKELAEIVGGSAALEN